MTSDENDVFVAKFAEKNLNFYEKNPNLLV